MIPVVFIHKGDPYYLNFSLNQVKATNPENPVYLITDNITNRYAFVNYIDINKYKKGSDAFADVYKHMSTNSFDVELFCFQRWFILREFCAYHKIDAFLYLDSDAMIYCNIDTTFSRFNDFDFTTSKNLGPHCTYFSSLQKLIKFCDFVPKLYTDPQLKERFLKKYKYHIENDLPGGVCDMTAFNEYISEPGVKAKDLFEIENNELFDDNINDSDGFKMKNAIKDLTFDNGFYYGDMNGRKIKFNLLHFQGPAKKRMAEFYTGKGLDAFKRKIKMDDLLNQNKFVYRVARRLGYKFY